MITSLDTSISLWSTPWKWEDGFIPVDDLVFEILGINPEVAFLVDSSWRPAVWYGDGADYDVTLRRLAGWLWGTTWDQIIEDTAFTSVSCTVCHENPECKERKKAGICPFSLKNRHCVHADNASVLPLLEWSCRILSGYGLLSTEECGRASALLRVCWKKQYEIDTAVIQAPFDQKQKVGQKMQADIAPSVEYVHLTVRTLVKNACSWTIVTQKNIINHPSIHTSLNTFLEPMERLWEEIRHS